MAHQSVKPYITPELQKKLLRAFCAVYNCENTARLELYIVGGSALQLKYGKELRDLTYDGDGWWLSHSDVNVRRYIDMVAKQFNVYSDWLNDGATRS